MGGSGPGEDDARTRGVGSLSAEKSETERTRASSDLNRLLEVESRLQERLAGAEEAARRFEVLADLLLQAAPRELLIRRLGQALARTSRQVHTLEQRIVPRLSREIARVRRTLDERLRLQHLQSQQARTKPGHGPMAGAF